MQVLRRECNSVYVFIIFVLSGFLQLGMCTGMILNLVKTLTEDREEIAASREKSLAASSALLNRYNFTLK